MGGRHAICISWVTMEVYQMHAYTSRPDPDQEDVSREAYDEFTLHLTALIAARTGGSIRELSVELVGEDLVLSGVTSTYFAKQQASHVAMEAAPDHELSNQIVVS